MKRPAGILRRLERIFTGELAEIHKLAAVEIFGRRADSKGSARDRILSMLADRKARLTQVLRNAFREITTTIDKDLGRLIRFDPAVLAGGSAVTDAVVAENVGLITTMAREHVDRLAKLYAEQNLSALHVDAAAKAIQAEFDVSASRAKFWARDQGLKFHSKVSRERAEQVGIRRYTWVTSHDERVRDTHDDLDGQVFTWSAPPATNDRGDENHPGEDYNCRCLAEMILD